MLPLALGKQGVSKKRRMPSQLAVSILHISPCFNGKNLLRSQFGKRQKNHEILLWEQRVAGSNPVSPIIFFNML